MANAQYFDLNWTNVGPKSTDLENYSFVGKVDVIFDNYSVHSLYLGADAGGFWKSTDDGKTWTCTSENIPGGVVSIAVNPKDSLNVFAIFNFYANGVKANGRYSYGLFESTDGGDNWTKTSLEMEPYMLINLRKIVFDKVNLKKMYVLGHDRLFVSSNLGKTWKQSKLIPLENESFEDIIVFENGEIAISGENCLYFSDKKQKKWKNKLPENLIGNSIVRISKSENKLWVSVFKKSEKNNFILATEDFGETFEVKRHNLYFKSYVSGIWAFNDTIVYTGGLYLKVSVDGANSFKKVSGNIHSDVRNMFFPDKTNYKKIYVTTDGGLFYSENLGKKWELLSTMSLYQLYSVAVSDDDSCLILTGAHDNGTLFRDRKGKWSHVRGGDGSGVAIDKTGTYRFAYANHNLASFGADKRWKSVKVKTSLFGVNVVQNPVYENVFYAGEYSKTKKSGTIVRSENYGKTFTNADDGLGYSWGVTTAIASPLADKEIVYYACAGIWGNNYYNLQRVEIEGEKITVDKVTSAKPDKKMIVSCIETDDSDFKRLWITFSGFDETKKIYVSYDEGKNWFNLTYDLPNVPVYTVFYADWLDLLLIGNDFGVYYLDGNEWKRFGNLPFIAVTDFDYNEHTKELFIATYARGVWKVNLTHIIHK